MKHFLIIIIFGCQLLLPNVLAQKTVQADVITEKITIDGVFDEEAWINQSSIATDFIGVQPTPNSTPRYQTEVKVLYDDESIYIAAKMHDASADSVMQQLTLRDDVGANSDFFGMMFDPYGNGNSGAEFILSSAGVQYDSKMSPNNGDIGWDAVWFSKVQVTEDGWTAEVRIPFAAFRFPKKDIQEWNVNFNRRRVADGTFHAWNNVNFEQNNAWLTQMGKLTGIQNIKSPIRLSFTPYAALYGVQSKDPNRDPSKTTGSSYNYGMDIKYGINDAYTLDMTLIPDFGQAQSDDQVLNLSPFEVRFNENRAFFTEGLEIFNKSGIFYSRRIGQNQQLYNATKVSGRNNKGLAIGFFNAVAKEDATERFDEVINETVKDVNLPLTNYNIIVLDQDMKNNSSMSLTNTNVTRQGKSFHNANVTAGTFNIKNKKQSFGIKGKIAISQLIHQEDDNVIGHDTYLDLDKLNGSTVYGIGYAETNKNYNHNDLGFFTRGNRRSFNAYFAKRDFDGFGPFNQFNYWGNVRYRRNIDPESYSEAFLNIGMYAQTKSFIGFNIWGSYGFERKDFFEPRIVGRHADFPSIYGGGYWFGTDQRKKLQFQTYGNLFSNDRETNWVNAGIGTTLRYRVSNKLALRLNTSINRESNTRGFVNITGVDNIIFGERDVYNVSNNLNINYTLNNKMGFDIRVRHYWSKVHYHQFYNLNLDGGLSGTEYDTFHDFSFNAFTIDAVYRWRFAPGSDLTVVWKNNISGVSADQSIGYDAYNYKDGINNLSALPQTNSLSLRFTYFLDYASGIKKIISK